MRKLIATEFVSLDGMMSDTADEMAWVLDTFSDEMGKALRAQEAMVDTMLLGRKTYDILAGYWPNASPDDEDPAVIAHMNGVQKVVFSRTLDGVEWNNARLASNQMADEVRSLKTQPGKNLAVVGSASVVQQLLNDGLIDELHLLLHPVVLGSGKPLFADIETTRNLRLAQVESFTNGVLFLRYQPKAA